MNLFDDYPLAMAFDSLFKEIASSGEGSGNLGTDTCSAHVIGEDADYSGSSGGVPTPHNWRVIDGGKK